jgi:hypothetical protein
MAKYVVIIPDDCDMPANPAEWIIKHALMCRLKLKNCNVTVEKVRE